MAAAPCSCAFACFVALCATAAPLVRATAATPASQLILGSRTCIDVGGKVHCTLGTPPSPAPHSASGVSGASGASGASAASAAGGSEPAANGKPITRYELPS